MGFFKFIEDIGVHIIDYSGIINYEDGLLRMEQLEKHFALFASDGVPLKLLFDVRNVIWDSTQTHDELAKIARHKFGTVPNNICKYVAVLNNQYDGPTYENEYWFTSKDEALNWLLSCRLTSNSSSACPDY